MNTPIQYRVAWWVLLLAAAPIGASIGILGMVVAAGLGLFPSSVDIASGVGFFAAVVAAVLGFVVALLVAGATLIVRVVVAGSLSTIRIARTVVFVAVSVITALVYCWAVGIYDQPSVSGWLVAIILGGVAGGCTASTLATRKWSALDTNEQLGYRDYWTDK